MNQILMIENKKNKKEKRSSRIEIASIVRFFAIVLIIFGLFFIGQGSYAMYKDSLANTSKDMPTVRVSRINDTVIVEVNSINNMTKLKYSWNASEETSIPEEGTYAQEEILLPNENSILNLTIEEDTGRALKYKKVFILDGLDLVKPQIDIDIANAMQGSIKVSATDDVEMAYITYKVNGGEEKRIDKSDLENKTINHVIQLPKGENNIVVTAVDKAGNKETKEKKVIITGKSTIKLQLENGRLVVIAEDPDGVKDIEINLNGVTYSKKYIYNKSVKTPSLRLVDGKNTVKVTVTNVNSLVTTKEGSFNNN